MAQIGFKLLLITKRFIQYAITGNYIFAGTLQTVSTVPTNNGASWVQSNLSIQNIADIKSIGIMSV